MKRRTFIMSSLTTIATSVLLGQPPVSAGTPEATPTPGLDFRPVDVDGFPVILSHDGTMIAGVSSADEVCVWDTNTFERRFTSEPTVEVGIMLARSLTWAPDDSALAFSWMSDQYARDSDIVIFELATSTLHNLTNEPPLEEPATTLENASLDSPLFLDAFPAWSPDGTQLAFARSTFTSYDNPSDTRLFTITRKGETITERAVMSPLPRIVSAPLVWQEDGSILYSMAPPPGHVGDNGVYRLAPDNSISPVSSGLLSGEMVGPSLFGVNSRAGLASIVALGNFPYINEDANKPHPGLFYLLDLELGIPTRFEEVLDLPVVRDDALAQGLLLDGAPAIWHTDDTPDPLYVYMTRDNTRLTMWIKTIDPEFTAQIGTMSLPEQSTNDFRRFENIPHIDIGGNNTMMVKHWNGTWIAHVKTPDHTNTKDVPVPCGCTPPHSG